MTKMITTFAAMTVALLGVQGCANTPSQDASATSPAATSRAYSSQSVGGSSLASNPNVPGATGGTIVPGDNSTIAGDRAATRFEQTGMFNAE